MLCHKSAAPCKIKYGCKESSLENRVPPEKSLCHLCEANANLKALSNTNDEGKTIQSDTDSDNLCVESCVTEGMTGFKNDFIPGS